MDSNRMLPPEVPERGSHDLPRCSRPNEEPGRRKGPAVQRNYGDEMGGGEMGCTASRLLITSSGTSWRRQTLRNHIVAHDPTIFRAR